MIIVGAGGHALEVYHELLLNHEKVSAFYDEINTDKSHVLGLEVKHTFQEIPPSKVILGTGNPSLRKKFYDQFEPSHSVQSLIASTAQISPLGVVLEEGLNIMHGVFIGPEVRIGKGTLINAKSSIHHETVVGDFCEICIGVSIAGACNIGNEVFVGMGALVLPGISIGDHAVIAAGAVVTQDVPAGVTVKGVPAK
jgi:sugar O-acyltransferase (sialic acid O-acetyltransferase NeuD family)